MTTIVELDETTTLEADDLFLMRQGERDGSVSVDLLQSYIYPVGTLLFLNKDATTLSPALMGLAGQWATVEEDAAFSPTVNQTTANLGDYVNAAGFNRAVKIPIHNHVMTVDSGNAHSHFMNAPLATGTLRSKNTTDSSAYIVSNISTPQPVAASGLHTHTTTLSTTGTPSVEVSIKGKFTTFVVWERIS